MAEKLKYKNISKMTQTLIGFGVVEPDKIITTDYPIQNPNFERIEVFESKSKRSKT